MATPIIDAEYEEKKNKAKELIAAGGCHAINFWSRTDAERLCPKDFNSLYHFDGEPPSEIDWVRAGKKAIELIQKGIEILEK